MPTDAQTETMKRPPIKVRHCKHADDEYSITLATENRHIDLSVSHWSHCPGGSADISIFTLSISEIKELGAAIISEAAKIELGAE